MIHTLQQRIDFFVRFGHLLDAIANQDDSSLSKAGVKASLEQLNDLISRAHQANKWFTPENQLSMIRALSDQLREETIHSWLRNYSLPESWEPRTVALILAGNIPMVGFNDIFCALMSGNRVKAKLSSNDQVLLPELFAMLFDRHPEMAELIHFQPFTLSDFDAAIATGSDNSSRYFKSYFAKYPHIIRKNRTSIAILDGSETAEELKELGKDIFSYFGLGCRNVTKLMLPSGFDLNRIFEAIYDFNDIVNHNKYANNYDYHKALWLLNQEDILDNGFVLFKQSELLSSPVGSLYFQFYDSEEELESYIAEHRESIQCLVGRGHLPFGKAQSPGLSDYADNIDTMEFLLELHHQP